MGEMHTRKSDIDEHVLRYRRSRWFQQPGRGWWCFHTREGDRGPFDSRQAAESELRRYVETMQYLEANRLSLPPEADLNDVTIVELDQPASR